MKLLSISLVGAVAFVAAAAIAAPGAHGPNGEHLDAASPSAFAAGTDPRAETFSETYELVARLRADALALELVRYASNEPVDNAKVEVESGSTRAPAVFEPVSGSYRVTDAALLKALRAQGTHALTFAITAGQDADLLEGKLNVGSVQQQAASVIPWSAWAAAASALLAAIVVLYMRRRNGGKA